MVIDTNSNTFPTKYIRNDTDYAKGWNACIDSVMQQKTITDSIESEILNLTTWLDGTCLVVSRDKVIEIISHYK